LKNHPALANSYVPNEENGVLTMKSANLYVPNEENGQLGQYSTPPEF